MSMKNVIWAGAATDPSGYGEATRGYLSGLARCSDLLIRLSSRTYWGGDAMDLSLIWQTLNRLSRNDVDRRSPYLSIQHLTPDQWSLQPGSCKFHLGVTTFETDSLPQTWQMNMRAMDGLITYSKWAKEVFESTGIRRPITVVPHGVDVVRFNPSVSPMDHLRKHNGGPSKAHPIAEGDYVFGANFDWTERKNPQALLKAYYSTFKASDQVKLVIKAYYQYPIENSFRYIKGYIAEVKKEMGLTETPPVILVPGILPSQVMPSFYSALDCYVLPSCGEGWGLTYSEAMATALPTIAVNWSGHTEFMNDENSLLCKKFKMTHVDAVMAGAQAQYIGHSWASVDVDELAAKMRWAFEHRDEAKAIGHKARETMVSRYTWGQATKILKARIDEIFASM